MKMVKTASGELAPVSNEEFKLVLMFENTSADHLFKDALSERDVTLATNMVKRGVLDRYSVDSRICYKTY